MTSVLLVEDDAIMGESICDRFAIENIDYEWVQSAVAALSRMKQRKFDCLVSDIRLPDLSGEMMFERARGNGNLDYPAIFITGYGTQQQAERLLAQGAADYLIKPLDLESMIGKIRLLTAGSLPITAARAPTLGISHEIQRLEEMVVKMGEQWTSVLVTGESGSGKEELARLLHRSAHTASKPFVAVNCGALPEGMMEAELFGYERGAFTGAAKSHRGYFEQANDGTVFLDEIGELAPAAQVRLLRVLQERTLTRLGSEKPIKVNFRLIAATHRDVREEVKAGRFREDLYYRINIIQLRVPPLRERLEDIAWLARQFLEQWNQAHPTSPRMLSEPTITFLCTLPWRGNIRELKHAIERACLLTAHPLLRPDDFEAQISDVAAAIFNPSVGISGAVQPQIIPLAEFNREQERRYLVQVLAHYSGQMAQTAAALGISRKTLWEKTRKLGIKGTES
ncbi:sigma-54-dependent transcriptional regulator [Herminiimonas arsenitoxidans]|uniref:sigma-54-dependent transcriptional regulator n=1 Tax=Herminiimonas arsenitoxidans TaxID=1809410 RepID=UPI0009714BA9|nr:sigma-54 dependent transcriptional regulator [Herminiimonas arsenitoxidans]